MLQNVARCCKPLYLGTRMSLRFNALKSSFRNYPKKSKYKFEAKINRATLQARAYLARRATSLYRCIVVIGPWVHQPPAGARVEMARAKKATLLQTTPRWNQQTLTSVVNGVVPCCSFLRSFFNRSSSSIGSESFERSPPPPAHPYPALTRSRSA